METRPTSHMQRSLMVKECIQRKYSGETILKLLDRINGFPEAEAIRIMVEMEEEDFQGK